MSKVVIIIPTYNEKESTEKMIGELAKILPQIPNHQVEVLYVDDTSPDGTYKVVQEAQKKYTWLHLLLNKEKQGLGGAYAKAMQYAMQELKADYLMEFDADGQHPPEYIPKMIAEIDNGYDYILGSRYIKGGSVPREWNLKRKAISWVGNFIARVVLLQPKIHDCTGGFKLSRVKGFMDRFDFNKLISRKFAYKLHLLAYMAYSGAKIKEVPFPFTPRRNDDSKFMNNEMKESLRVIFLFQLQNPKIQRFLKFAVVGGTGLVIQTAFFEYFGVITNTLSPSVATTIGGELAIISNFTLNNLWTFREYQVRGLKIITKFLQFNFTSLLALAIQFTVLKFGEMVANGNPLIIQFFYFGALIIVIITNYYIYNKFIWKTNKSK